MKCIEINQKQISVPAEAQEMSLLDFLRESLHLTGTKNGCGIGVCGSCTVLIDDEAKRACRLKVGQVLGHRVLTIEGMENEDGSLHPLQQAFLDAGAVQCGFCTPGMILSAHALLLKNPRPVQEEVRLALKGNLCRCTGYQQIIDAVLSASDHYPQRDI